MITDNDEPPVVIEPPTPPVPPVISPVISIGDVTVIEGDIAIVTISLDKPWSEDVTVSYSTANGSAIAGTDYDQQSGTAVIAAGQTSVDVQIGTVEDQTVENTEQFVVNLSSPVNATIADPQGLVTILDDDVDGDVTIINVPVAGSAGASVAEAGLASSRAGDVANESAGSAAGDGSNTTTGTITYAGADTPLAVMIGGVGNVVNAVQGTVVAGAYGTLTVTALTAGSVAYSYTLSDNTSGDADTDVFTVQVEDADGDDADAVLTISIVDDMPIARDDTDAVLDGDTSVTGNVMTGLSEAGTGAADTEGADGGIVASFVNVNGDIGAVGGAVLVGLYGNLALAANGDYTYTQTSSSSSADTDVFTYTLEDGDGDISTATLTIALDGDVTIINVPVAGSAGASVAEAGLASSRAGDVANESAGSAAGDGSNTTTGTITYAGADTPLAVMIGGVGNVVNAVQGTVVAGAYGTLTVTALTAGSVAYSYTLSDNTSGDADTDVFTVQVEDADGDDADAVLTISIVDDMPIARDDTDAVLDGDTSVTGNVMTGLSEAGTGAADTEGADGGIVASFVNVNGDIGAVGGAVLVGLYGNLALAANGDYTYTQTSSSSSADTDVFTYTLEDGDGDISTATLTIALVDNTPVTSDGSAATDDTAAAGTAVDTDSGTLNFQNSSSADFTYDGGLGGAIQSSAGGVTTFSATDSSWEVAIDETTGAYTFTQNEPYTHQPNEDQDQGEIAITLTSAIGANATSTLTLTITDAGVTAVVDDASANEPATEIGKDNLVLVLDLSGSMRWDEAGNEPTDSSFSGPSRLDLAKVAIADLFATTYVNAVYIVTFASDAQSLNSGQWYTDLDAALDDVNVLIADGGTDYDAALEEVVANVSGNAFPAGAAQTEVIFLTDGEPQESNGTGSDGIDEGDTNNAGFGNQGEESYWIDYLVAQGFDSAYAIGFGGIGAEEISELEPIAVDVGNENADLYDGNTDANDDNVIIVANGDSVSLGLQQTLDPVPAVGNVLDNDTGVDAPLSLASVSFGSDSHDFATDGDTATFTLSNTAGDYGTVEIDSTGAYSFLVTELLIVLETTVIDYVAQDSDGDSDAATLTLQAAPRVEVASIAAGSGSIAETGPSSQSFTVTLQSAPLASQGFAITSAALASGDVVAVVSGTGVAYDAIAGTVTVDAGVTGFTVTLTAVDDMVVEGTEASTLTVGEVSIDFSVLDNDSYTVINATVADDALTGDAGLSVPDLFTWELADVQNTISSAVVSTLPDLIGQLDSTDDGGNDIVRVRSDDFEVSAGESVSVTFTANVENLDDDTSGTNVSLFRWRVEDSDSGASVTLWESYDNDSNAVQSGDVVLNLSDELSGLDGTYRLEFQALEGAHADITDITLTTNSPSNTDTLVNFDVALDALDIGDLLVGGGELLLNFDSGEAQVVISNAGGQSVDQVINLNGVTESILEASLGLDSSADATSIVNAMLDQGKIISD